MRRSFALGSKCVGSQPRKRCIESSCSWPPKALARPSSTTARTAGKTPKAPQPVWAFESLYPSGPNAARPRWVSTSSSQARRPESPPAQPKQIPRFYALFPETLPDGPPPAGPFQINVRALRREFLRLQAAAHPDFHHHAAGGPSDTQAAARSRAEAASALINEAYKTLSSPLLRAQYLLRELHSADLAGDEAGGVAEADPELLMLVLDAREAIEEAESEADLEDIKNTNEERIRLAEESLATAFHDGNVEAAKLEAVRLRYWVNIKDSLDNWESGKPVVLAH